MTNTAPCCAAAPTVTTSGVTGAVHARVNESARLGRSELTAAQRSSAIRRRKEIWEALHPEESGRIPPTLGGRGHTSFASETAEVSGESKRRINEHLARAEALGDDLDEVVGTSLDKGVELDALAKMPEPQRRADKLREGIELQRWLWQRAYAMERNSRVLCGARRRRDGQPCQALSVPGKRRCKWHGGCSTGPRTAEGKAKCAANLPRLDRGRG